MIISEALPICLQHLLKPGYKPGIHIKRLSRGDQQKRHVCSGKEEQSHDVMSPGLCFV